MGNNKTLKRKVQITSIITLFVFLFDIYLIIYVPTDYILATAAFVTLVFSILLLNSWFKLKDMENQRREEQYNDIMKAEKGTYVITLDMMKQLDDKINFIGQKIMPLGKAGDVNQRKIASMLDGIVEDQKKIAKITISRNKENADALMNSNDQLLVQMREFRNVIESIKEQVNRQSQENNNENIGEIKDELFEKMKELTESIKKEVDEISENIEMSSHAVEDLVSKKIDESMKQEAVISKEVQMEEPVISKEVQVEEPVISEEVQVEEPAIYEEALVETSAISQEVRTGEPVIPEEIQTDEPVIPEEIQIEEPVKFEEVQTEELGIPEAIEIDGDDIISELLMEKKSLDEVVLSEEVPIEEFASESVPDMSDPNKPMSPEDIAALIANTATEDLPDETVKFEEEETPPMPDMTDPNKMMSPEDIAALIANM